MQLSVLLSVIGILASAGVALFTYKLASSTKKLAEATASAVSVEREALEQTKDGLMPVLRFRSIELQQGDPSKGTPDRYTLVIENIGDGAAFMRDVTVRDEVGLSDLFNSELRTAVVGKGQTLQSIIGGTNQFRHFEVDEATSWSLWYTDIYGR